MQMFGKLLSGFIILSALAACQPLPPIDSPKAEQLNGQADVAPAELPTPDTAVPRATDAGNQNPTEGISPRP
jgi:hypothetical protein